jgi:hypothetical protein
VLGAFLVPDTALGVPVGPVVGVLGNLGVGWFGAYGLGNRAGALAPALGWLLAVVPLAIRRREGDLVLTAGTRYVAFLLLGVLAAAAALGTAGWRPKA